MNSGTLFVVATPIGNRDDLTPRARRVLSDVDLVAAEDTRHTGRLLSHFGIRTPLMALHEHNEQRQSEALLARLAAGESVALVSDAGTPLISDPGYRLVAAAHAADVAVSPVPGASSVTAALSAAGLPTDRFAFEGFLPAKAEARRAALDALRGETRSMVFLESVHRIEASLADMKAVFGERRPAFVAREMTKIHEQCVRGSLGELAALMESGALPPRGEFVVVVGGNPAPDGAAAPAARRVLAELLPLLPGKQAVELAVRLTGANRNEVYRQMLELKEGAAGEPE